ncbi:hypothetical protein QT972_21100, partial [Microcoleus sp. herbarium7]|uniref:hypothetical protein n=1 Tax=Microcoleus sp. herbarium7 TaxID=3055435 RepID=UPI002FD56F51
MTYQRFYSLYHGEYFTVSSSQYQQSRSKNLTDTLKPAVAPTAIDASYLFRLRRNRIENTAVPFPYARFIAQETALPC